MIGAGLAMLGQAAGDVLLVSPGDQRINQPVTACAVPKLVAWRTSCGLIDHVRQPESIG